MEGISTVDLLDSTDAIHEQEVIGIISLLDLDEATMLAGMGNC